MTQEFEKIALDKIRASIIGEAKEGLAETLLETCADQEYRLCLLELGIN